MSNQWEHQVIIITGASAGIGKGLAYALAPLSPKLVLVARDRIQLEHVAENCERLRATTLVVPTDVADPQACAKMIQCTIAKFSRIDVLVNNAGISMWSTVEDVQDVSQFQHIMEVNFLGSVYCTKFALPFLKETQGRILAISSVASLTGVPSHAVYCASKHAMNGFFESLRTVKSRDCPLNDSKNPFIACLLVNNAGISMWLTVEDVQDVSQFQHIMEVNFWEVCIARNLPCRFSRKRKVGFLLSHVSPV